MMTDQIKWTLLILKLLKCTHAICYRTGFVYADRPGGGEALARACRRF